MKYFRLYISYDKQLTGAVPQVVNPVFPTTRDNKHALGMLLFSKAGEKTEIPYGRLQSKAKYTDLMGASFIGKPLVSKQLKEIMEAHAVYGIEFLKSKVVGRKEEREYWFVHPFASAYDMLDFEKSVMAICSDAFNKTPIKTLKFTTAQELELAIEEDVSAAIKTGVTHMPLVIQTAFFHDDSLTDFFAIRGLYYGGMGYFVSEKLRLAIESAGCTGVVFTDPNQGIP